MTTIHGLHVDRAAMQVSNLATINGYIGRVLMATDALIGAGYTVLGFRVDEASGAVLTVAQPTDEQVDRMARRLNGVDTQSGSLMWFEFPTPLGHVWVQWYERRDDVSIKPNAREVH